jgi:hypothetical protein
MVNAGAESRDLADRHTVEIGGVSLVFPLDPRYASFTLAESGERVPHLPD